MENMTDDVAKKYALENLDINELEVLLSDANALSSILDKTTGTAIKLSGVLSGISPLLTALIAVPSIITRTFTGIDELSEEEIERIQELLRQKKEEVEARKLVAQALKDEEEALLAKQKADDIEAYLAKLQREFDMKNALMELSGEDAQLQKELFMLEAEKANLIEDSLTKYGVAQERMMQIFGGYFEKRKAQLEEEYRLQKQLQELNEARGYKEEFLNIRESFQSYTELQKLQKTHLETLQKINEIRDTAKNAIGAEGSTPESDALNMTLVKYMTPALKKQAVEFYNEQYQAIKKVTEASGDLYNLQEQLKEQALSTTVSITTEAFKQMGEALGGFNNEGESFSITMARMVADMTSAMSTMFVTAGLQVIIKGAGSAPSIALGVSLMALGGVTGIYSGYLGNKIDEATQSSTGQIEVNQLPPPSTGMNDAILDRSLTGGTSRGVINNVYNSTGQEVKMNTSVNSKGQLQTDIIIGKVVQGMTRSIMTKTNSAPVGIPLKTGH